MNDIPVVFEERPAGEKAKIGILTLNAEKRLNALTLEMVTLIREHLESWIADDAVVCILVTGAGQRAFCAGGDVIGLRRCATETIGDFCSYAEAFFEQEYRMDYLFSTCPKPVIVWGHGIVMGGGIGILAGCTHRIVTPETRMAMPEITIGLYPDVGAGWFFNRMPGQIGLFLALTGATFNATDSLYIGIADYCVPNDLLPTLIASLAVQPWKITSAENHGIVDAVLTDIEREARAAMPEGRIEANRHRIDTLCGKSDITNIVNAIISQAPEDPWMMEAKDSLMKGSALSAVITHRHLTRCRHLSLREVFQSELILSTNLVRHPEFGEGVRALLIDKDKHPKWRYQTPGEIPEALIAALFKPPWRENPLSDLT